MIDQQAAVPPAPDTIPHLDVFEDPVHAFEALVSELAPIVDSLARRWSRRLFARHGEHFDDLRQAGLLALHDVLGRYKADKGSIFGFAHVVVKRALWHAGQKIMRKGLTGGTKSGELPPLTLSIDAPLSDDGNETTLLDTLGSPVTWAMPARVPAQYQERDHGRIAGLARANGLEPAIVYARLVKGWTERRALTQPKFSRAPSAARPPKSGPPKHVLALMAWSEELKAKRRQARTKRMHTSRNVEVGAGTLTA